MNRTAFTQHLAQIPQLALMTIQCKRPGKVSPMDYWAFTKELNSAESWAPTAVWYGNERVACTDFAALALFLNAGGVTMVSFEGSNIQNWK